MFYRFLAQGKFNHFKIDDLIKTLRKYGVINATNTGLNFRVYEDYDTIDIYYDNLHIQKVNNQKEKSLQIAIKFPNDTEWVFEGNNHKKPLNHVYRVYYNCEITMMDDGIYENDIYKNGSWDKYVYKTMRLFERDVISLTDTSKFNESYKKNEKNI